MYEVFDTTSRVIATNSKGFDHELGDPSGLNKYMVALGLKESFILSVSLLLLGPWGCRVMYFGNQETETAAGNDIKTLVFLFGIGHVSIAAPFWYFEVRAGPRTHVFDEVGLFVPCCSGRRRKWSACSSLSEYSSAPRERAASHANVMRVFLMFHRRRGGKADS